ncbi:flagellar brake protein [Aquincola sp. J276]|uniref:flagellar brake protein n=1 Tax=Aquincola sp. J276 TaxID=2898432 RepID=UPI002150CA6F|nr:flagellar brake protein [Aquincola sp. J276]MCR5868282.1 flagellar brake protein [Aquincola sp. J276]
MSEITQPAPLDALSGDERDNFRVGSPEEVAALLRELLDEGATVHLSAPDGSAYTTVWTVDAAQRKISFSADATDPQLQALVDAGEATVVGYLDNVKLQFDLQQLLLVHGHRASALQAQIPAELFRFQRRSSFRVRPVARNTPAAYLRHPSLPDMQLSLRVLDVSLTGCAIFLPDDVPPLPPGVRLQGARIELDAHTRFEATLQLHHVTSLNPQSGGLRLGCSITGLDGEAQRALQRYIDQTQKRRRLLALD